MDAGTITPGIMKKFKIGPVDFEKALEEYKPDVCARKPVGFNSVK